MDIADDSGLSIVADVNVGEKCRHDGRRSGSSHCETESGGQIVEGVARDQPARVLSQLRTAERIGCKISCPEDGDNQRAPLQLAVESYIVEIRLR